MAGTILCEAMKNNIKQTDCSNNASANIIKSKQHHRYLLLEEFQAASPVRGSDANADLGLEVLFFQFLLGEDGAVHGLGAARAAGLV